MRYSTILLLVILLAACKGKRHDPKDAILALREMSELATVQYNISKVIKANDNKTWYKMGDRKILMTCWASIKAGIDIKLMQENDIVIKDKTIELTLPHAKLINFNMPPDSIKIAYQEAGPLRDAFSSAEKDALLVQGEQQIKGQIESMGVYKEAEKNTELFVHNFLNRLGYEKVIIHFGKPATNNQLD